AGFRIDAAYGANHFRSEQDVLVVDHVEQQVDAFLVVNAGVEVHVVHHQLAQWRQLEHVGQAAEASPVVGYGAAAVRNDELDGREVLAHGALHQLHEGRGVGAQVVGAGGVAGRVAAAADVDQRRYVEFHHLCVDRVPEAITQRRRVELAPGGNAVEVE